MTLKWLAPPIILENTKVAFAVYTQHHWKHERGLTFSKPSCFQG